MKDNIAQPDPDPAAIEDFIDALWPKELPKDSRILIWSLQSKLSMWASSVAGAVKSAVRMAEKGEDVYIGAGLGSKGVGTRQRTTNATVTAIPGVWVDLDYADDVHKKVNLPTLAECESFIRELSDTLLEPTITVHSGHGFQLWWICSEPMMLADGDARHRASATVAGWMNLIRQKAAAHGWDVDATHDLARVLRIPGTVNHKSTPVAVTMTESGPYWQWEDIQEGLPAGWDAYTAPQRPALTGEITGDIILDQWANPPFDKWRALCENEHKFELTWNHKRKDWQDQSQSSYDIGIANYLVQAEWTDQEIVDALIANRREHHEEPKLRDDYYRRTLLRAHTPMERSIPPLAVEPTPPRVAVAVSEPSALPLITSEGLPASIDELGEDDNDDPPYNPPPTANGGNDQPLGLLRGLSKDLFNGRSATTWIERIIKYRADPPTYTLEVNRDGKTITVTLGNVENLIMQRKFRNHLAATADILVLDIGKSQWEKRVQLMLDAAEEKDLGDVGTPSEEVSAWMNEYLDGHQPSPSALMQEAIAAKTPYWHSGFLCFSLNAFTQWLNQSYGERVTLRDVARFLRMAGYEQYTQATQARGDHAASTRSVWRIKNAKAPND